ncbi:hypothetical protein L2E82_26163 [Cichorium intybus]|uniref:Uncharacterized protein n=1 Tax=Cichorium intybus TaxID=13427 RepID=A0ACB9E646_CICIN|nr:hypothetical protein L2E82_26163 [Cichorium intybus]
MYGFVVSLKGIVSNSMSNLNQIKALIQAYSSIIYFHPDDPYLPYSSKGKLEFINLSLGKFGEHVGEWEHVTLRVRASDLQYYSDNKSVVYALLHAHASYPKPGCVLLGSGWVDIGVRDKSDKIMDTRVKVVVIVTKYMESAVVEPPWLNYERKWSPEIDYDVDKEMNKVTKV